MLGTTFDCPLTVKTSVKHCPAVEAEVTSGGAISKVRKSNLLRIRYRVSKGQRTKATDLSCLSIESCVLYLSK